MSWYNKIKSFLDYSDALTLEVGERTPTWIESFKKDLLRYKFPVSLKVKNPVIVKGKVPVEIEKEGL